jgi:hypothetical protein
MNLSRVEMVSLKFNLGSLAYIHICFGTRGPYDSCRHFHGLLDWRSIKVRGSSHHIFFSDFSHYSPDLYFCVRIHMGFLISRGIHILFTDDNCFGTL